ncbi:unnamed protein product [marine sediment metagenome]|uniref:Uncharacterized protein n=1 Tax=marine sediment metagenome TaxID=412755 RepID=X0VJ53_9ZZZZ
MIKRYPKKGEYLLRAIPWDSEPFVVKILKDLGKVKNHPYDRVRNYKIRFVHNHETVGQVCDEFYVWLDATPETDTIMSEDEYLVSLI